MHTVAPLPAPSMPAITISSAQFCCFRRAYWALSSPVRSWSSSGPASSLDNAGSDSASSNMMPLAAEEQLLQRDARFGRLHEGFAHQEGMHFVLAHQVDV